MCTANQPSMLHCMSGCMMLLPCARDSTGAALMLAWFCAGPSMWLTASALEHAHVLLLPC